MTDVASPTYVAEEAPAKARTSWFTMPLTVLAIVLSSYFFIAAFSLYWLTAIGAAIGAFIVPRKLLEKGTLAWLTGSWLAVAALTQGISGFFAKALLRPIDAVFTRIGIANTIVLLPVTVMLFLPSSVNYLVLAAYGTA